MPAQLRLLGAFCVSAVLLLSSCRPAAERGTVLRLVTTQQGDQMREPFRAALRAFEREHPGVRIELSEMDDDVYQKMGLVTLFVGGTPPDVYFQWGGYQVRRWAAAGYALDLSAYFTPEERSRYWPTSWASATSEDGRVYLWPNSASLTTVFWYRRSLFAEAGVQPPRTWEDMLTACEQLKAAGKIPIAAGNRELWPGGNWASYFIAQYAGTRRYAEVLGLKPGTRLDDPLFVRALELLVQLQHRGYLNRGVAGVGTDEARSLLVQGRAAMHPIGDWLVSEADPADVADLDAFRLPHMPGQQGDDSTLLALTTGYMINGRTRHPKEAVALLRHFSSDLVQQDWAKHGHLSAVRAAAPGAEAPLGQRRLLQFLSQAKETALAPDIGFNLEVSDAFLDAVSLVLAGRATPAEALGQAERQVRALREGA